MMSNWNNAKNLANMPIFAEDNNENSKDSSPDLYIEEEFSNTTQSSSALKALQSYGPLLHSPCMQSEWDNEEHEKTFSGKGATTIETLNLKTVDEEDEYLYGGDSNSLPEGLAVLKSNIFEPSTNNIPNNEWSDEEYFVDSTINQNKLKLNFNSPVSNARVSRINKGGKSRSSAVRKPVETTMLDNKAVYTSVASKGNTKFSDISKRTNVSEESAFGSKVKYHLAAQKLREQTTEKTNILKNKSKHFGGQNTLDRSVSVKDNSSSGCFKHISGSEQSNKTTNKRTVVLQKNPYFDRSLSEGSKISNAGEDQRHVLKTYPYKNIDGYLNATSRKRPLSPRDELKGSSFRRSRNKSASRHSSPPFESSRMCLNRHSRSPPYGSRSRSKHHSPHRSPSHRYRHHSPPISKHKSLHEDYDRQSYEYSPHHHSYDKYRHYSRSPIRKSREKSPGYYKYKNRSPSASRERSKSPLYRTSREHSPKHKYHKIDSGKSLKKSQNLTEIKDANCAKKRGKMRDGSSDSFRSESSGSINSYNIHDKNLLVKKKNIKLSENTNDEITRRRHKIRDSEDTNILNKFTNDSPEICEIYDTQSKRNEVEIVAETEEEKSFLSIFNSCDMSIISEIMRAQQTSEESVPMINLPMLANIPDTKNAFSNEPQPLSFPQLYPYNSVMSSMPISFSDPVSSYQPVMPSHMLPPSELHSVPSYSLYPGATVNASYIPSVVDIPPPVNTPSPVKVFSSITTHAPVFKKRGPATLRKIPVSNNLNIATRNNKKEKSFGKTVSSFSEKNKFEKKEKTTENNRSVSSFDEFKTKENYAELIQNYKKLKNERCFAQNKLNGSVKDIIEIKSLMEQTFGKKTVNSAEKVFYFKCRSLLNECNDKMKDYIIEAKSISEELEKLNDKIPKEIQNEVSQFKFEDYVPEETISSEKFNIFDPGKHSCYTCNRQLPDVSSMIEHLHSTEHKERTNPIENEWIEEFRKTSAPNEDNPGLALQPVSGIEFMKPISGFFCTLCKEHCLDNMDAELHMRTSDHYVKYKKYLKDYPLYLSKCQIKRLIKYSAASKERNRKIQEEKQEQITKRKKEEEAADKKVKEIIKDQKSKEKDVEELEETDIENSASKNSKLSDIKLTLSGDKEKMKPSENKNTSKQKVVYIGKAPNFKTRPKPWYKREMFSEKDNEFDNAQLSSATIVKELKEKISSLPSKESPSDIESKQLKSSSESFSTGKTSEAISKLDSSKTATGKNSQTPLPKKVASTCLTERDSASSIAIINKNKSVIGPVNKDECSKLSASETLNSDNLKNKTATLLKSKNTNIANNKIVDKSFEITSRTVTTKLINAGASTPLPENISIKVELPKSEDPCINKAITNILNITDSAVHKDLKLYSLAEIKLPQNINSELGEMPMDISSVNEMPAVPIQVTSMSASHNQFQKVPPPPKNYTEEEKDFLLLAINKDDMKPLAIPVPPPMSILNFFSTVPPPNLISHDFLPNTNYIKPMNTPPFDSYQSIPPPVSSTALFQQPISTTGGFLPSVSISGGFQQTIPPTVMYQQPVPSTGCYQQSVSAMGGFQQVTSPTGGYQGPISSAGTYQKPVSAVEGFHQPIHTLGNPNFQPLSFKKQLQKFNKSNLITISPSETAFITNDPPKKVNLAKSYADFRSAESTKIVNETSLEIYTKEKSLSDSSNINMSETSSNSQIKDLNREKSEEFSHSMSKNNSNSRIIVIDAGEIEEIKKFESKQESAISESVDKGQNLLINVETQKSEQEKLLLVPENVNPDSIDNESQKLTISGDMYAGMTVVDCHNKVGTQSSEKENLLHSLSEISQYREIKNKDDEFPKTRKRKHISFTEEIYEKSKCVDNEKSIANKLQKKIDVVHTFCKDSSKTTNLAIVEEKTEDIQMNVELNKSIEKQTCRHSTDSEIEDINDYKVENDQNISKNILNVEEITHVKDHQVSEEIGSVLCLKSSEELVEAVSNINNSILPSLSEESSQSLEDNIKNDITSSVNELSSSDLSTNDPLKGIRFIESHTDFRSKESSKIDSETSSKINTKEILSSSSNSNMSDVSSKSQTKDDLHYTKSEDFAHSIYENNSNSEIVVIDAGKIEEIKKFRTKQEYVISECIAKDQNLEINVETREFEQENRELVKNMTPDTMDSEGQASELWKLNISDNMCAESKDHFKCKISYASSVTFEDFNKVESQGLKENNMPLPKSEKGKQVSFAEETQEKFKCIDNENKVEELQKETETAVHTVSNDLSTNDPLKEIKFIESHTDFRSKESSKIDRETSFKINTKEILSSSSNSNMSGVSSKSQTEDDLHYAKSEDFAHSVYQNNSNSEIVVIDAGEIEEIKKFIIKQESVISECIDKDKNLEINVETLESEQENQELAKNMTPNTMDSESQASELWKLNISDTCAESKDHFKCKIFDSSGVTFEEDFNEVESQCLKEKNMPLPSSEISEYNDARFDDYEFPKAIKGKQVSFAKEIQQKFKYIDNENKIEELQKETETGVHTVSKDYSKTTRIDTVEEKTEDIKIKTDVLKSKIEKLDSSMSGSKVEEYQSTGKNITLNVEKFKQFEKQQICREIGSMSYSKSNHPFVSEESLRDSQSFEDNIKNYTSSINQPSRDLRANTKSISVHKEFELMPDLTSESTSKNLILKQDVLKIVDVFHTGPPELESEIFEKNENQSMSQIKGEADQSIKVLKCHSESCVENMVSEDTKDARKLANLEKLENTKSVCESIEVNRSDNLVDENAKSKYSSDAADLILPVTILKPDTEVFVSVGTECVSEVCNEQKCDGENESAEHSLGRTKKQKLDVTEDYLEDHMEQKLDETKTERSCYTFTENEMKASEEHELDNKNSDLEEKKNEDVCHVSLYKKDDTKKNDSDTDEYENELSLS